MQQVHVTKPWTYLLLVASGINGISLVQCTSSGCPDGGAATTSFFTPAGCVLGVSGVCAPGQGGGGGFVEGYIIPCDAGFLDPNEPAVLIPGELRGCTLNFICADRHQETVTITYSSKPDQCIPADQSGSTVCAPCVPTSAGCATDAAVE